MPHTSQLTNKTDAVKIINTAKTLFETTITSIADLNHFTKALRDQLPVKIIVAK